MLAIEIEMSSFQWRTINQYASAVKAVCNSDIEYMPFKIPKVIFGPYLVSTWPWSCTYIVNIKKFPQVFCTLR